MSAAASELTSHLITRAAATGDTRALICWTVTLAAAIGYVHPITAEVTAPTLQLYIRACFDVIGIHRREHRLPLKQLLHILPTTMVFGVARCIAASAPEATTLPADGWHGMPCQQRNMHGSHSGIAIESADSSPPAHGPVATPRPWCDGC
jgi:hypothetical protein